MDPRHEVFLIIRKVAIVAIVVVISFYVGWSTTGFATGFVFAIALGTGSALAVFGNRASGGCVRRRSW